MPLVETVRLHGIDLTTEVDGAARSARAGDWDNVIRQVRILTNILRPQAISKNDVSQLDFFPFDVVLYEFSPEFRSKVRRITDDTSGSQPIRLIPEAVVELPRRAAVQDVVLSDFDLDGVVDLVLAESMRFAFLAEAAGRHRGSNRQHSICGRERRDSSLATWTATIVQIPPWKSGPNCRPSV